MRIYSENLSRVLSPLARSVPNIRNGLKAKPFGRFAALTPFPILGS
jgi:hypothetical protein